MRASVRIGNRLSIGGGLWFWLLFGALAAEVWLVVVLCRAIWWVVAQGLAPALSWWSARIHRVLTARQAP